jgi:putative pyruvate formate lyase activating enzyme
MTLAKTPWYWETVTRNLTLIAEWGEDFSIRHLVMPNHVECCTYPVLEWIAEHVPEAPVNVMAQFHPDNFCDPASAKYRDKYAEIARRPSHTELNKSWRRARELGLKFETTTFERGNTLGIPALLECDDRAAVLVRIGNSVTNPQEFFGAGAPDNRQKVGNGWSAKQRERLGR